MKKPSVCTIAALIGFAWAMALSDTASAYLRLHPDNPHYFQETTTGKAVMIASHSNCAPSSRGIDYQAEIDGNAREGMGYARIWHWLPWEGEKAIWPWGRSAATGPDQGGAKYDFDIWNDIYWDRLKDCLARCNRAGIYAEVMLFEACGMKKADTRWRNNPWASNNNINALELPGRDSAGVPEFYEFDSKPNLRRQQERYLRKILDETAAFPNVMYELENEHYPGNDAAWAAHYARFVKDYLRARHPDSPRLLAHTSDFDVCFETSEIDIVNFHSDSRDFDKYNRFLEGNWKRNKAMNVDELANGETDYDALRKVCWTIVTSGGHFHIEDAKPASKPFEIARNILAFNKASGWDFVRAAPCKRTVISDQGYCMAQPGVEYVFFFPSGGGKTVELAKGNYRARWWNTRLQGFSGETGFSHEGGTQTFTPPDLNDWVLHVCKDIP